MSGNPNVQQINNVGLLSAASTSNFFPNSISSIVEDAPSAKTNSLVALRVSNLPRDLQLREFNVLFTFAPDFVYTELLQSPALSDDGLPASVVGIGYFKSLPAASNAMAVLTRNPLIFAPREIFNRPNVSTSSFMLKCDIRTNVRQNEAVRGLGYNVSSQQQASQQQQSQQQQHNSTSPVAQLPQQPQQNVGPFKGSTSRFVFPSGGISTPQMELGAQNYPEAYIEPSGVLSPPSVFSPTSPRSIFPGEPEFMARISGKSLLLESQGKEDEEYSNMVKDPMGWFNMNNGYSGMPESNSSPVGFNGSAPMAPGGQSAQLPKPTQVTQPGQAQQAPVQSQGGIPGNTQSSSSNKDASSKTSSPSSGSNVKSTRNSISGAAPVNNNNNSNNNSNSNNSNGPPSGPNPWNDKRRGSTIRGFQNLSVSNDNNSKNGTFSPSSTASNSSAITSTAGSNSTSSNNNGSNGNSNDNNSNNNSNNSSGTSSAPVILPGGATRVLPPANPADQNPPCNTLYVGNLPPDTNEDELKDLFSARHGYKRLCFRTKANGPMCFVEFEDVSYAGQALEQLYGVTLSNSVKGGIRLSYSKNPLGVRSSTTAGGSNQSRISSGNNGNGNGNYGASRNYNSSNNY